MAYYAALVSLMQLLEDIVHRHQYQTLLLDIQQQMAPVYEQFSLLQRSLDDYSPKDTEKDHFLEGLIRDAACQAQDLIESHISDQIDPDGKILRLTLAPQAIYDIDNEGLEKVKKQVDTIVKELLTIKNRQKTEDLPLNYYSIDAETSKRAHGHGDTTTMVGVEDHLTTIKDQLCGGPSRLQVVSIVGMGGIGKTTLAKNIYHDEHIGYHFDRRAWVTVSQNYHFKKVLIDILDSLNVQIDKSSAVQELGTRIYKHLNETRHFIIIDDMWETKVWDDIKSILPDNSNGSRIMITTRNSDVASYASTFGFSYPMKTLNKDQSWDLFSKNVCCPPELTDIGRLIVENCRGLPLAIVVVAGLLSKVHKKHSDWEWIAGNVTSVAVENDEHFSKILTLSYNHLPRHLKPLFLHIGGYPEDYKIPVSRLIKLWVAEGFLKPIESKSFEEVAVEYLEDLVNRNLVLITKKTFSGKIQYCSIHDVLRDLCIKIAYNENFFHLLHKDTRIHPTTTKKIRRLYFDYVQSQSPKAREWGLHVRSIIFHGYLSLSSFGLGCRLLRVLDAVETRTLYFSNEILVLFHLRYLALPDIVLPLPPFISKLQNLQTLILRFGKTERDRGSLPCQIWEMPNLRHVIVDQLELPLLCKDGIVGEPRILENLQTLSWVSNMRFTNEVIEMIPNLEKLSVIYNADSSMWQELHLNNLFHLRQIKILRIEFSCWSDRIQDPFPESFALPLTLSKLSLRGCRIPWKDMTVVGSLSNLQKLELRDNAFIGEKWESVEGEFVELRFLIMQSLGIKCWQAESSHFPRLQRLKIISCRGLQEIPHEIGEISTIELVEMEWCSELAGKSAMKMQQEQRDIGNDELQVRVKNSCLHGRKILFVDDNQVYFREAARFLEKYCVDIVHAERGKDAISLLTPPHLFDACLMDIQMPEMDGFEATKRIRDIESSINNGIQSGELSVEAYGNVANWRVPILATTADVTQATIEELSKCGMDGFVSKPFQDEQLYREVSSFFPISFG